MLERFQGAKGSEGHRLLVNELKQNPIVQHNEELAESIAAVGNLEEYADGEVIIIEGADDNDVYFLITGTASVSVKNRYIAKRKAPQIIGEMVIVNASERRSATLTATEDVVALKVSEADFQKIAAEYSQIWKAIAGITAERLRQRSEMLDSRNTSPRLFIGCSTEALQIASAIQAGLQHEDILIERWVDGVFGASDFAVDNLLSAVNESDFAVFVFSPDDVVTSRDNTTTAPRDNIIFELGLFMGKLERRRTFIVKESSTEIKIPTDLLGITPLKYIVKNGQSLAASVGPICEELKRKVRDLGTR